MSLPDALPKIGGRATRALVGLGITTLDQLAGYSRARLAATHGVGPKRLGLFEAALAERGQRLAE